MLKQLSIDPAGWLVRRIRWMMGGGGHHSR
jgi:hypothetical protein